MPDNICCKDSSSDANEHLYGTAPKVDNWLLLEYPEHWEKESLEKSSIPGPVKEELNKCLESLENSRLQLIQRDNNSDGPINFYYIKSTEIEPKSYHFQINSYEELIELDLINLLENGDLSDSETDEKIVLVCTHGAYDSCCGKFGVPVYKELEKKSKLSVWKSTHVGSHRFSANIVMLPEGVYYGRVSPENVSEIAETHLKGEIAIDNYRGRCCFRQAAQVSDYFLRKQLGENGLHVKGIYEIEWVYEKERYEHTSVEFLVEKFNLVYSVNTMVMNSAIKVRTSCTDSEPESIPQFYFYSIIPYEPEPEEEHAGQE